MLAFAILDHALLATFRSGDILIARANGILDGPGDGDTGHLAARIMRDVTQHGDGQTGFFRIERDEGGKRLEPHVDWQTGIVKLDL